jgi:ATP-dependent Clp protease ATP-binding subunit ClpB
VDYLVKKSYSLTYGARNLRRTIQKDLEDAIAERIIDSFESPISQIKLRAEADKVEVLAL